eukprot:532938-Rhodomonas_salina.1
MALWRAGVRHGSPPDSHGPSTPPPLAARSRSSQKACWPAGRGCGGGRLCMREGRAWRVAARASLSPAAPKQPRPDRSVSYAPGPGDNLNR